VGGGTHARASAEFFVRKLKMSYLSVLQLLEKGSDISETIVEVEGWIVDRFEHKAIYGSMNDASKRITKKAVWLSGGMPKRNTARGKGSLDGALVRIRGKFHWQPNRGAGHGGLFSAWIGVQNIELIQEK
jgi:hypothetical protein